MFTGFIALNNSSYWKYFQMQPGQIKKNRTLSVIGVMMIGVAISIGVFVGKKFFYDPFSKQRRRIGHEQFLEDYENAHKKQDLSNTSTEF